MSRFTSEESAVVFVYIGLSKHFAAQLATLLRRRFQNMGDFQSRRYFVQDLIHMILSAPRDLTLVAETRKARSLDQTKLRHILAGGEAADGTAWSVCQLGAQLRTSRRSAGA